jgi:hypothetical protein
MGTVLVVMVVEWPIFLLLALYLDQVHDTRTVKSSPVTLRKHTAADWRTAAFKSRSLGHFYRFCRHCWLLAGPKSFLTAM